MNGMWNRGNQSWRLPDSAGKADDPSSSPKSESQNSQAAPSFEIDFASSAQENNSPTENQSGDVSQSGAPFAGNLSATGEDPVLSLEIGQPGQFESRHFEHAPVGSEDSATAQNPLPDPNAIVMLDDPLPTNFSSNVDVQDQFVAEVLKVVQDSAQSSNLGELQLTLVTAAPPAPATEIASEDKTIPSLDVAGLQGGEEKTVASYSTSGSLAADDKTLASSVPSGLQTNDDQTIPSYSLATPSETPDKTKLNVDFSPPTMVRMPSSTPVSNQSEGTKSAAQVPSVPPPAAAAPKPAANPQSGTTDADKTKIKKAESGTKVGDPKADKGEKTKASGGTKVGAAGKDKAAAGAKKGAPANQKDKPAESTAAQSAAAQSAVASPSATLLARARGTRKDVRILLGLTVVTVFMLVAAMFKKFNREKMANQMSTEIPIPAAPAQPSVKPIGQKKGTKKSASKNNSKGELDEFGGLTPPKNKSSGAAQLQKQDKANSPSQKTAALSSKSPPATKDKNVAAGQDEGEGELDFLLTRPMSRYSETNRTLAMLVESSIALDRVQPRRVISLLRALPENFSSDDPVQKTALHELTARYYMQVGAYQKASILFRRSCPDPSKSSEVEVCLHAARSYAVMGQFEDAREIAKALSVRMIGQNSQWREWLKLVEVASELKNPSPDVLARFADEMSDKGPFMTSEWNLQLSTLYARTLLNVPNAVRIDYLKVISGTRKKLIEVRLSPEKYGQDIGSYMFPAITNLMLRHYEYPQLSVVGDEPETDSELGLTSWILNVIGQARSTEPRETRARLAPLFAERGFSALARLIEGQLAAQAGDYVGAHAMILEQIGPTLSGLGVNASGRLQTEQVSEFISSTQRLKSMPYLFVEWLFLGVKVSAGLNDKDSLKTYVLALENARRRFPELGQEIQYWIMLSRAHRVLEQLNGVEKAVSQAEKLAVTNNDLGFVAAERIWLMMRRGQKQEARALMRQKIREIPHHARLLEVAAEFSSSWNEEPSFYLRLEAEIPQKYQSRGRDSVLLSFFTLRKLLSFY